VTGSGEPIEELAGRDDRVFAGEIEQMPVTRDEETPVAGERQQDEVVIARVGGNEASFRRHRILLDACDPMQERDV